MRIIGRIKCALTGKHIHDVDSMGVRFCWRCGRTWGREDGA